MQGSNSGLSLLHPERINTDKTKGNDRILRILILAPVKP
jgi:hypothetical protein